MLTAFLRALDGGMGFCVNSNWLDGILREF